MAKAVDVHQFPKLGHHGKEKSIKPGLEFSLFLPDLPTQLGKGGCVELQILLSGTKVCSDKIIEIPVAHDHGRI